MARFRIYQILLEMRPWDGDFRCLSNNRHSLSQNKTPDSNASQSIIEYRDYKLVI